MCYEIKHKPACSEFMIINMSFIRGFTSLSGEVKCCLATIASGFVTDSTCG